MEFDFSIKGTISSSSAPKRWSSRRKRCTKGKSCSATCIQRGLVCRVELGTAISSSLSKYIKIRKNNSLAAHPSLAKDFSETNVRNAIRSIEKLDPDAKRRVKALVSILDKTKTVFIDWKDSATNREVFKRATEGLDKAKFALIQFDNKAKVKTWGGVAFGTGVSLVKASPGFKPSVRQIKKMVDSQLVDLSQKNALSFAIGKGTKAVGNNPLVTMIHELGHQAHFKAGTKIFPSRLLSISKHAVPDYKERFAELFVAYMFSGPKLKELYPYEYSTVENTLNSAGLL